MINKKKRLKALMESLCKSKPTSDKGIDSSGRANLYPSVT